ncbi:MAG: PAS domain S-box protein [Gracilimonas sp.]|uniref:response regulator n=1 Tax=Gracilimonas sp. TaxID=1974203 RepID=UPI0019A2857E|nr:response regulator [Gracilimonas sp.]MBD3615021.1 PAS domain S-box protein [Gracilimonas sp.]
MSRNILTVTKSEREYKPISQILQRTGIPASEIRRGQGNRSLKRELVNQSISLIIIDLSDLELSGYEVIDKVKELDPDVSVTLIKDNFKLDEAVKLVKAGATDLIEKDELESRLEESVEAIFSKKFEFEKNLKISDLNRDLEEILNNHIINSLPGIFFVIDKTGQIISVNNRFREKFEYEPGEDNHYTNFVSEEDYQAAVESFDTTLKYSSNEVELFLKTKDGGEVPYLLSGITTTINNEMILVGTGIDIKDRKEAERKLLQEQSFTEKVLDSIPGLFYVLDEDMNYIRVNQSFIDQLGYSWQEIQDMHPLDFYFEDDHERIANVIKKAFEEGSASISARVTTKNGEHPYFYLTGSFFNQDGTNYILGTGVDITQQVNLEDLLKQAQRMAKIGAWEYDLVNEKMNWTEVTRNILEVDADYDPDLEAGINFYVGESKDKISKAVEQAIAYGESYDLELKVRTGKGKMKWIRTIGEASFRGGKCVRLHGSFQDITDKKLAEERIKESLKEKEILLMEVHHRVKNNLALVSSLMQLQAYQADEENVYKYLHDNQSRIKSIALIHEQLYQHHDFTYVHLDEQTENLVKHISDSIGDGTEITIDLNLDEVIVNINQAVPYTLILNEVITNTYKHAFNEKREGQITVTLGELNGLISLTVKDNGVGFKEDFDFETPTTLGMTLIKTLSDQLYGSHKFDSGKNGSTFSLEFGKNDSLRGASSSLI